MKILIHKSNGGTSIMQLIPHGVRRTSDGKIFSINDKIERQGKFMVTNVLAVEPTPLEDLPGEVAAAAINIIKVGEISARRAFGIKRVLEPAVPFFDVIYTPVHEGFKASFDHDLMMGVTKNDEWEFLYPDVDAEVEKWKGDEGSDHRALYVSHEVVDAAEYVGVRAIDLSAK